MPEHGSHNTDANGRVAILTGATGWIGHAAAVLLAKEGYRLALLGRRVETLERLRAEIDQLTTHSPISIAADLTRYDEVEAAVETVVEDLGPPHVLINNAGGWSGSRMGGFLEKSAAELGVEIDDNLLTTVLVSRAVLPAMVAANYGRIVNVSSIAGLVHLEGHSAYSAAKAGHHGLTRQLAVEFGRYGITTNCVAPGAVLTKRAAELLANHDELMMTTLAMTPTQRLPIPEDVAELIAFLASDRAAQINGQTIVIDGGMTSA